MITVRHAAALNLSLLASLGILPLACGGTTSSAPDENGGGTDAGGASAGGTTSKAGSTGKAGGGGGISCTSPVEDPLTGLVTCKEGYVHRPRAVTCGVAVDAAPASGGSGNSALPAPGGTGSRLPQPDPLPRADGTVECADDASKCSQYLYGYCDGVYLGGLGPVATCRSGCFVDEDCGPGNICLCGDAQSPTSGVCRTASCRTDADCATGYQCAAYSGLCGPGGFACQTPADQCMIDADCQANGICGNDSVSGFRACTGNFVCGRPFLVEDLARVAPAVRRADWHAAAPLPRVDHLTAGERMALADHWTRLGQLEHASIAAFARFSLQLLSLGAPPALVEACTAALADETAHTKLCFGIASAFAGRSIGPGPLDVSGSLVATSLTDIVELVIAEGCFGETRAALDALEAAETAADPVIRAAYAQIAADEQRHAALAFSFVRWALERDHAGVAARIAAAVASAPADAATRSVGVPCLHALLDLTPPALEAARGAKDLPAT